MLHPTHTSYKVLLCSHKHKIHDGDVIAILQITGSHHKALKFSEKLASIVSGLIIPVSIRFNPIFPVSIELQGINLVSIRSHFCVI